MGITCRSFLSRNDVRGGGGGGRRVWREVTSSYLKSFDSYFAYENLLQGQLA